MFNNKSRTQNTIKNSTWGVISQITTILFAFVYRILFVKVLNESYLGLNSLFSNIFNLLSLAELGIGTTITYRLYKTIKDEDEVETAKLLDFFKKFYLLIAGIIFVAGMICLPFINFFISDPSQVPADVNIYFIYLLFLFQIVVGYFWTYKNTLLAADQNAYVQNKFNVFFTFFSYTAQVILLFTTKNYTLILIVSILIQITQSLIINFYISKKYKFVFVHKAKLEKQKKNKIIKETGALMCHRIGYTLVNSTDNIIISKFIGLSTLGIYSNYSLITMSLTTLLTNFFSGSSASLGNLNVSETVENKYKVFKRMLFINLAIAAFCSICLFCLLNPFISVVFGAKYVFSLDVVFVVSFNFYFNNSKIVLSNFITNFGYFVRDKIRPLIEAAINLIVSLILVQYIGIVGVLLGTIISSFCTAYWRDPYILFKYEFKRSQKRFWLFRILAFVLMAIIGSITYLSCYFIPNTWYFLICRFAICAVLPTLIFSILFFKNEHFRYCLALIKGLFEKIFHRNRQVITSQAITNNQIETNDDKKNEE